MAHRILDHKMPRKTPRIPPLVRGCVILGHTIGCELHRHHEPPAHEVLQVCLCDL
jgi:hypothetical protein